MKRAVVNVGTDQYWGGSRRLRELLPTFSPETEMFMWNTLIDGWPSHADKPYAFKAHALMMASVSFGADLLLWCDSAVIPVKSLEPLWQRIEKEGYWFAINGWTNYEWTADSAYPDLFPHFSLDAAREVNKTFPQVVATAFGLNVKHPTGKRFLDEYFRLSNTNAFCGPWTNSNSKDVEQWRQDPSRMGPCGPPDVLGHRHDQTAASVLAWRLGMKLTQCPSIFAFPPAAEDTILLAVGA